MAEWLKRFRRAPSTKVRSAQLRTLADLARRISELFRDHGDSRWADQYVALADESDRLLRHGFTQRDLTELSTMEPGRPEWLSPRYADFNGVREPWQEEVALLDPACRRAALELRVLRDA